MISQKEYEVLLIESNPKIADSIVEAFQLAEISISIAESPSLIKAGSLITSQTINLLIFGPSLSSTKVFEFFESNNIRTTLPSLFLFQDIELETAKQAQDIGVSATLQHPIESSQLRQVLEKCKANFLKKKDEINPQELTNQKPDSGSKIGTAHQLALIIDRLTARLGKVTSELRKLPGTADLQNISIPEAVNKVILGATQFRKDKETEDLASLIQSLIKTNNQT